MGQVLRFIDPDGNIVCHQVYIGEGVKGFVHRFSGKYHIFISESLCDKVKAEVLAHEIAHIKKHMPYLGYSIGMDMQRTPLENEADEYAREEAPKLQKLMTTSAISI